MEEGEKGYKKRTQRDYSHSFKLSIIEEFLKGTSNITDVCSRYGIQSTGTLRNWIKKFGNLDEGYQIKLRMKKTQTQKILELEQQVKLLEKQKKSLEYELERSDKKALFFDMMIDIAEDELKIPIRKKSLSDPSKSLKVKNKKK
jgi:transposase-like protein